MEVKENNFKGITETCPYCKSVLELKKSDYRFSSNTGELAGVGYGWIKYYDCPCCDRRVILESKSWDDESSGDKTELYIGIVVLILFLIIGILGSIL